MESILANSRHERRRELCRKSKSVLGILLLSWSLMQLNKEFGLRNWIDIQLPGMDHNSFEDLG